jgi:hypothetical protein
VCAWLGNSPAIAQAHYLQVTDEHFDRAAAEITEPKKAARNAAQHAADSTRFDPQQPQPEIQNPPDFPGDSVPYDSLRNLAMTPMGFEPMSPP